MIKVKYDSQLPYDSIQSYCDPYLVSKIFKLLPMQEEGLEWKKYLYSLNQELLGAEEIFLRNSYFLSLINKIESLLFIESHEDFRKTIFECIGIAKAIPSKMIKTD